jgi:hypothetical protein
VYDREISVGWPYDNGGFCTHWYIGKWGFGAELGPRGQGKPVVIVDYDVFRNEVEIITVNSYKHKHGGC